MIVTFLDSVVITNGKPSPAQIRILCALDEIARETNRDITVTCAEEGHGPTDPHTLRKAMDIRTIDLTPEQILIVYNKLKVKLGNLWTILYESPTAPDSYILKQIWYSASHPTGPHIHIQPVIGTTYP